MTVFYRGPCVRLTHEVLEVHCPHPRWYLVRDLEYLYSVQERVSPAGDRIDPRQVCTTVLAGGSVIVATATWQTSGPMVLSVGALAVALSSALVSLRLRARARTYQIWGLYRGDRTCLFSTVDQQTFNQLSRALVRVMERLEDAR